MRTTSSLILLFLSIPITACSGESPGTSGSSPPPEVGCVVDAECSASSETPLCDVPTGQCSPLPAGHEIGWRDGSPGSVDLIPVFEPDKLRKPTDLAFNPERPSDLWVVNRSDDSVIIITNPGAPDASSQRLRDPAADHFMDRPPAIAFGAQNTFGTCGDNNNHDSDFVGPSLFSADLEIFAVATPGGLGSHLDMLHSTSFCRGIAHEAANIYWVFNSDKGSIDKYDFGHDHGPGNDDHADGEIYRYATTKVAGVEGVSSHIFFNQSDKHLYIADTGNKRIVKLDTQSGTMGASFSGQEPVVDRRRVYDAVLTDIVPPGLLEAPSGLEVHNDLIYITDNATSRFYAFDFAGQLVRTLDTGLPPGSLSGLTFGPDQKVYFVDHLSSRVYRIEPK
jgi:hypothetical protein